MSFNIFRGKSKSQAAEKRTDVQSPLISGDTGRGNATGSSSRAQKASRYFSQESPPKNPITRSSTTSMSRKLSVVDLLEQAEQQTEMFSKLFPLIDKEKFKTKSESSDSDDDMAPFEQRQEKDSRQTKSKKSMKKEPKSSTSNLQDIMSCGDGATCSDLQNLEVFSDNEASLIITNTLEPPHSLDRLTNRRASSMTVGVHIEYLILDNKLKVSVHHLEDEVFPEKERKRKIAKLFLLPGNLQCQKVNMISGTGSPPARQCAYFSGIDGSELVKMAVGVGIYVKQGFLKKDKLLIEWSIPLCELNLMEPQTAWKIC